MQTSRIVNKKPPCYNFNFMLLHKFLSNDAFTVPFKEMAEEDISFLHLPLQTPLPHDSTFLPFFIFHCKRRTQFRAKFIMNIIVDCGNKFMDRIIISFTIAEESNKSYQFSKRRKTATNITIFKK